MAKARIRRRARRKAWAARAVARMTQTQPAAQAERQRIIDAALCGFRVSAAGVDVTMWGPNRREWTPAEAALLPHARKWIARMIAAGLLASDMAQQLREQLMRAWIAQQMGPD